MNTKQAPVAQSSLSFITSWAYKMQGAPSAKPPTLRFSRKVRAAFPCGVTRLWHGCGCELLRARMPCSVLPTQSRVSDLNLTLLPLAWAADRELWLHIDRGLPYSACPICHGPAHDRHERGQVGWQLRAHCALRPARTDAPRRAQLDDCHGRITHVFCHLVLVWMAWQLLHHICLVEALLPWPDLFHSAAICAGSS